MANKDQPSPKRPTLWRNVSGSFPRALNLGPQTAFPAHLILGTPSPRSVQTPPWSSPFQSPPSRTARTLNQTDLVQTALLPAAGGCETRGDSCGSRILSWCVPSPKTECRYHLNTYGGRSEGRDRGPCRLPGLSKACDSSRRRQGAPEAGRRPILPGGARSPIPGPGGFPAVTKTAPRLGPEAPCSRQFTVRSRSTSGWTHIIKALLPKISPAAKPFGKKTLKKKDFYWVS